MSATTRSAYVVTHYCSGCAIATKTVVLSPMLRQSRHSLECCRMAVRRRATTGRTKCRPRKQQQSANCVVRHGSSIKRERDIGQDEMCSKDLGGLCMFMLKDQKALDGAQWGKFCSSVSSPDAKPH